MKLEEVETLKTAFPGAILEHSETFDQASIVVEKNQLIDLLNHLKRQHRFDYLVDLTAVDYLEPVKQTKVVYSLRDIETKKQLRISVILARQEPLPSVTRLWRGADWYERELYDLFGVLFSDREHTERILMPDDWQGHPLRRDYALTEESVEFKHGVMPKVPSEIIPYVK